MLQPGAALEAGTVTVIGRVDDDGQVARVAAGGLEAGPASPQVAPYGFQVSVPLEAGPNLLLVEAVDDFGRAAFAELPLGGKPLLLRNAASRGLALSITPDSGYREMEALFRPFPLPELNFDLNRDGAPDARLSIRNATFALVDTTGDSRSDWLCVRADLGS
jgi:hypothetical protein